MKSLSELIAEQKKKDKERFNSSKDKNENYYYQEKQKRVEQGIEEELIINDVDEFE